MREDPLLDADLSSPARSYELRKGNEMTTKITLC